MSEDEFRSWGEFYRQHPFDDKHRFHRPAALVYASAFSSGDRQGAVEDALEWLAPEHDEMTSADMATMRAFGFTRKGE